MYHNLSSRYFSLSSSLNDVIGSTFRPHPPSPSSPDKILMSPETLSHHSSPARSIGQLRTRPQHVTILDETTTIINGDHSPRICANSGSGSAGGHITLSASQHQLLAAAAALSTTSPSTAPATGSTSISPTMGASGGGPLALLYHTSASTPTLMAHQHHHHHHLHPILPVVRRPNRSPETMYTVRQPEIRA